MTSCPELIALPGDPGHVTLHPDQESWTFGGMRYLLHVRFVEGGKVRVLQPDARTVHSVGMAQLNHSPSKLALYFR